MTAKTKKGILLGQRHLQALLLFVAVVCNYYAKLNTSVAVVAMTNAETTNPDFEEYDWSEMEKHLIISSFFWGYFLTQFPGGYLCRRFGAKIIMLISTLGSAVLAAFIPISVYYGGWRAYCAIRVGQGLSQGFLFPCVYAHLAAWSPPIERNRLGAFASMGIDFGTILSMFVTGMIAVSPIGWPGISYLSSGMGLAWCILWLIFGANTPYESKFISQAERDYIEDSMNALKETPMTSTSKSKLIPWRAIWTSPPFLASLVAATCQSWGFFTLQAEIPTYMNTVLDMDMKRNALYSALPYVAMLCMSYVFLIMSDILLHNNILSLNALRKTFITLAFSLPAAALIALGFLGKEENTLAIVLMTISVGLNAGTTIGCSLNTIDLSPNHSSILMGINNTFVTFIPVITPVFVGLIITDQGDRSQWQIVFATSALFLFIGNLVFIIFGTTNLQPWDDENFLLQKSLKTAGSNECSPQNSKEII